MRDNFTADWAFGVKGAIENVVRQNFPSQLRQWPLLQSFNFEAYQVGTDHFVIILRDKLSGIPAGPGQLSPFPYEDYPPIPSSLNNLQNWLLYLVDRFSLRNEDAALVLPIHDSGQHDAKADYEMFSEIEKTLWSHQLRCWMNRMKQAFEVSIQGGTVPNSPTHVTYNVSGTNARVTINSSDNSVNVVDQTPPEVFEHLLEAIRGMPNADAAVVANMVATVEDMKQDYGSDNFRDRYQTFTSTLADHIQVFGPSVAPYLPNLSQLFIHS
jgi:hypothetical protein